MTTEKVGIEIELMGGEEAFALLQRIDTKIESLNKKRKFNSLSGLKSAKAELESYITELQRLQKEQKKYEDLAKRVGKENMSAFGIRDWERNTAAIERTNAQIEKMSREMDEATIKTKTLGQVFNSISSKVAHVGSAMQSMGNALTRIGSFMRPITSGLLLGAGYKALNLFTEGLENTFERSDTMRNYDRSLKALGLDVTQTFSIAGKEAKTAKENLDDAVQGLPTSLDEIMAAQKVYAGATGEMVSSTKTAIAANNAFLASSTDSRQQRILQRYFVALASGANLTSIQWAAMQRNMPLAFRKIGEAMGYMDVKQFQADLASGTASAQEFLETFQELGTSGVIRDAAMVMTKSWSGLSSNIRIAVTRMGANVIDTLNETFKKATGRDLLETLLGIDSEGRKMGDGIRDWINGISESVQNWIKANPDRILDFFNTLKGIDWKGLLKGMAQGIGDLLGLIERLAKVASNKDMAKLGRFLAKSGFWGRALTIFGGFIKGMRHPLAAIGTVGSWLFGGRAGGFFGKIASLFGKKKDIDTAGKIGEAVTKASPSLIKALKNTALISGIVGISSVTAWGVSKATKASIKNFKETIDLLKQINWDDAKKVLAGIGGFLGGSALLGMGVGKLANTKLGSSAAAYTIVGETLVGVITGIATGFAALDSHFVKSAIKDFVESVNLLNQIPDVKGFGDIKKKVGNAIKVFNEVSELFNGTGENAITAKDARVGNGVKGISLFKRLGMGNLAKGLKSLIDMVNEINQLGSMTINEGAEDNVKTIIAVIKRVATTLGTFDAGMTGLMSSGIVKGTMKNVADELLQLRRSAYHINELGSTQISVAAETNVGRMVNTIGRIARQIGNVFGGLGSRISSGVIKGTMGNIRKQLVLLRKMAYHINALGGTTLNTEGFSSFISQLKDALSSLSDVEGDLKLDVTVKLNAGFQKSVNDTVKKINKASKDIKNAINKIPIGPFTKTVTINIKANVKAASALGGIASGASRIVNSYVNAGKGAINAKVNSATGGLVYRAGGGGIPFRRRGTDTVPAMLTPGEYVHNRQAVSTFGIEFMRKVNNLDMRGAMNELMHRAGHMANINRGTTITNNNYNNQKVVINNSNAGAGYTFRTASRFVGAF
mgnify:CR=1 FL=1